MPDLRFRMGEPAVISYAAIPTLAVPLHVANVAPHEPVQSILLNCQVQIEPLGRSYSVGEEARLLDLFGERERWALTMKPMLWTNQVLKISSFVSEITAELQLPCTMDFEVAATKYFFGVESGSIRVSVLFSGTAFYGSESGQLQVMQIPWDRESRFQLPVEVWRAAINAHYRDAIWLRLPKDTFDKLYQFKVARGIPTWDAVIRHLMKSAGSSASNECLMPFAGVKE